MHCALCTVHYQGHPQHQPLSTSALCTIREARPCQNRSFLFRSSKRPLASLSCFTIPCSRFRAVNLWHFLCLFVAKYCLTTYYFHLRLTHPPFLASEKIIRLGMASLNSIFILHVKYTECTTLAHFAYYGGYSFTISFTLIKFKMANFSLATFIEHKPKAIKLVKLLSICNLVMCLLMQD